MKSAAATNLVMLTTALLVTGAIAQEKSAPQPATPPAEKALREGVPKGLPKVLFVTESRGFVHPVVKRAKRAMLSHAERCLTEAAKGRYEIVCTQDLSAHMKAQEGLNCQAIVFYTSGNLPLDDLERNFLLLALEKGMGFVGLHSASNTFETWPAYTKLVGGIFDGHPWHQKATIRVHETEHPIVAPLGPSFEITDEIYQFRNFLADEVEVLLSLDPKSVDISKGNRKAAGPYPLAWTRSFGKGRAFYCALGHRPEVWRDKRFTGLVLRGIEWTIQKEQPRRYVDLFGKTLAAWKPSKGKKIRWKYEGGVLEVAPSSSSLMTRESFGDCAIDFEFSFPEGTPERGGDSGVVLQRHYEVQLLDPRGVQKPGLKDCGAIYGLVAPSQRATRSAGQTWHRMEIEFRTARFDESGQKISNARMSVRLNDITIHDDVEVPGRTADRRPEAPGERPILLEDRGERVRFRNFRVARLAPAKSATAQKQKAKAPADKRPAPKLSAPKK